jgi:hypothetical protein
VEVCAANPEAVVELDADGCLIEMTLTGGSTSARNSALLFQLQAWDRTTGDWIVFDSSAGFQFPDGSLRSPDASLVRLGRWLALSDAERDGFPPLCPDLVVELASPSDQPQALRRKLSTFMANGARPGCSPLVNRWRRASSFRAGASFWRRSGGSEVRPAKSPWPAWNGWCIWPAIWGKFSGLDQLHR